MGKTTAPWVTRLARVYGIQDRRQRRIGEALKHAYNGDFKLRYGHDEYTCASIGSADSRDIQCKGRCRAPSGTWRTSVS